MRKLSFIQNYANNQLEREKLFPLFENVFGIQASTLADFSNRGLWNKDYRPYTFFDGDRAVSNVSAFPLEMLIDGEIRSCFGIQSVMTDPDYRKNGLMKELFQKMLDDLENKFEGAFLFTSSPELYTPFGFKVMKQHYFKKTIEHQTGYKPASILKMKPLEDAGHLQLLTEIFNKRQPLSKRFTPINYLHSVYFNLYNPWIYEKIYYIEKLNTMVVFEIADRTLRLFDMIGETISPLEELTTYIESPFDSVEFYFNSDLLLSEAVEVIEWESQTKLMVIGSLPLEKHPFIMPFTSEF